MSLSQHIQAFKAVWAERDQLVSTLGPVSDTDFLPAALEITERPVSPTARITAWVLLGGLVVTLGWLSLGRVDVVASAQGRLIPADNVKLVQPSEAGIVRAIHVRDGQRVVKGQILVELDPTVSTAESIQAESALRTAALDAARARAVLAGLESGKLAFTPPAGTPADIAATQGKLAAAELERVEAGIAAHGADRQSAVAARAEALGNARKLTETIPLLDQQLEANETLLAKGYVSKLKVIEMRRQRLATIRDRDIAYDTARRMAAEIGQSTQGLAEARAEARRAVLEQLAKAEGEVRLRTEELTKAKARSSRQLLTAPVSGTVAQLQLHTLGGVVEPAKPVMTIVPEGGGLILDAKVLNKDAGFVTQGQAVAVKLEAFPFTRYGAIPGTVERIGSDAVEDEKLGLVYPIRVRLERATIAADGRTRPLTPGMAATADVKTGRRSILSYLTSPVQEATAQAGSER